MSALPAYSNVASIREYKEKLRIIEQKSGKKPRQHRPSTRMECLYNDEEIMAVYNVFQNRYLNAKTLCSQRKAIRDKVMFICSINIGLRGGDFCALKWSDLYDENWNMKRDAEIIPQKTSHSENPKRVKLIWNNDFKQAILIWYKWKYMHNDPPHLDEYIFTSQRRLLAEENHIRREDWWRTVKKACKEAGIEQKIGTHGLRKTMGHQYVLKSENKGGAALELMEQFNHSDMRITMRYICIQDEKIKETKEKMNLFF